MDKQNSQSNQLKSLQVAAMPSVTSIAIPGVSGGGAETFTRNFAIWLRERNRLSRIFTADPEVSFAEHNVPLGSIRAHRAILPFFIKASNDPAESFLLTLGYIGFSVALRATRPKTRVVVRVCNPPMEEMKQMNRVSALRYWIGTWLSCASADCVVVQSDHMKLSMLKCRLAPARKLRVIHNPVDGATWKNRGTARPFEFPYLLCASTNKPQKDLRTLIFAFAKAQSETPRHLVLAGARQDDEEIVRWINECKADKSRVHCLGFVENVHQLIEHSDLCVLPSLFEGFSNFLLEAGAYGKKIVATDCPGGNAEFFSRYTNKEIVGAGDPVSMSRALLSCRNDLSSADARLMLYDFCEERIYAEYCDALFSDKDLP